MASPLASDTFSETLNMTNQGATAINLAAEEEPAASQGVDLNSVELNLLKTLTKPYAGMLFETLKEAGNYYEEYGRQQGFWTRYDLRIRQRREQEQSDEQFTCSNLCWNKWAGWSYHHVCKVVTYFYKNLTFTLTQFWFTFQIFTLTQLVSVSL